MNDLCIGALVVRAGRGGPGCLRLDWLGRSDGGSPAEILVPFFDAALAEASLGKCSLDMHFEALEHFNSATFATLIQLMYSSGKAKVPLRMFYDARRGWQALAFEGLERAAHSFGGTEWPKVELAPVPP